MFTHKIDFTDGEANGETIIVISQLPEVSAEVE
jgi:hypothetical protein